jgi:hypothetical protein
MSEGPPNVINRSGKHRSSTRLTRCGDNPFRKGGSHPQTRTPFPRPAPYLSPSCERAFLVFGGELLTARPYVNEAVRSLIAR